VWLGAKQKDVLKNFEWKVRETERENAKAVGIYEWPRRGMLLLIRLWKRESYRISPVWSCSMAAGKIAASGLLKDSGWLIRTYYEFSSSPLR
jgi:hypothetical protein